MGKGVHTAYDLKLSGPSSFLFFEMVITARMIDIKGIGSEKECGLPKTNMPSLPMTRVVEFYLFRIDYSTSLVESHVAQMDILFTYLAVAQCLEVLLGIWTVYLVWGSRFWRMFCEVPI